MALAVTDGAGLDGSDGKAGVVVGDDEARADAEETTDDERGDVLGVPGSPLGLEQAPTRPTDATTNSESVRFISYPLRVERTSGLASKRPADAS